MTTPTPVAEAISRRSLLPALLTLLLFELVGWSALYAGVDRNVGFGVLFWGLVVMVVATCVVVWIAVRTMAARRFRFFTLREFLVLTVLIGAALGWAGSHFRRTRQQRLIADALVAAGARVEFGGDDELQGLVKLLGREYFYGVVLVECHTRLEKAHIVALGRLSELESLHLDTGWLDSEAVAQIPTLPKLNSLSLYDSQTNSRTNALTSLTSLQSFPALTRLTIVTKKADNNTLACLRQARQLKTLSMHVAALGDADLAHIGQLYGLNSLTITCNSTDAGLEQITGLQDLTLLSLHYPRMTDAGLEHVGKLRNLKTLSLSSSAITDAGMQHLEPLDRLEQLFLKGTSVTPEGTRELRRLHTKLRLHH